MPKMTLPEAWEKLTPLVNDLSNLYPKGLLALQFRGFNAKSYNSPKRRNTISLWINTDKGNRESPVLLKKHRALLREIWSGLLEFFGDRLDRVMIAPPNSTLYKVGIYPASTDINEKMPVFWP